MIFPLTVAALAIWLALSSFNLPDRKLAESLLEYVTHNFAIRQDIHILVGDLGLRFPDLVEAAQRQLDHRLRLENVPYVYNLVDELPKIVVRPRNKDFEPLEVILTPSDETATSELESPTENGQLDSPSETSDSNLFFTSDESRPIPEYQVQLVLADRVGIWHDLHELKVILTYSLEACHQNDLPFFLTQAVIDHLMAPDLELLTNSSRDFSQFTPLLKINIVAAEELGESPETLKRELGSAVDLLASQISPYVETSTEFVVVDVTKKRVPTAFLSNTTSTLNLFYLTSLAGITNKVQGVDLFHIHYEDVEERSYDPYGTAHSQQRATERRYNSTEFVKEATLAIIRAAGLGNLEAENVNLLVESTMKHSTISGVVAVLEDLLRAEEFDSEKFQAVATLVDTILSENSHDWSKHLKTIYKLYRGKAL